MKRFRWSIAVALVASSARADVPAPPWIDQRDVRPPAWMRSVMPKRGERGRAGDMILFHGPSRASGRRGVTVPGALLPLFGSAPGGGCSSRWWLVGPSAWVCADGADLSGEDPVAPPRDASYGGLFARYFFVHPDGASGYASLEAAEEGTADRELEGGWAVAIEEERGARGERYGRTRRGLWLSMRDLDAAHPSSFHGETIDSGAIDVAWVVADRASVFDAPLRGKKVDSLARFTLVHTSPPAGGAPAAAMLQLSDGRWAKPDDFARPVVSSPPPEVARAGERWIDVDRRTQTLVAYEGSRPVFATLVSTGRGGPGSGNETPPGVHRIWVKILASDMDNVENDDVDSHYSMADVPYVQFFDKAVALHGTYWHRDFGRVKSHGCVNLAPLDAQRLFDFTGPHVPASWAAAYPTSFDEGTVVRVR